ncbi:MAG: type II secretion system protein [Candidatus Levybacteria bacterium]|nr:type II secretion system protein [Candidatus Levybacteria bacterium]
MKTNLFRKLSSRKGFTLIELLIVIAILGVLAAGVLVLIDPVQQLARARDAGRKNSVGQLARAVQAYLTTRQSAYPNDAGTWITTELIAAGEIQTVPANPTMTAGFCAGTGGAVENGYCYNRAGAAPGTNGQVYVRLESQAEIAKCSAGNIPFFQWVANRGTTCLVCTAADPGFAVACNAVQ